MKRITLIFAVSLALVGGLSNQASAQGDQMGVGDSLDVQVTQASNNATSPAIYEIPNSRVQVKMTWQPDSINTNETSKFAFEFIDTDTEQRLQDVTFSVHMTLDGKSMSHGHQATAPEGIGMIEQKFDSTGSLSIVVESIKVGDTVIEGSVQYRITVVPEFPSSLILIPSLIFAGIVAASRLSKMNL